MRSLPEQVVHLPFAAGPYRMAMDLITQPEAAWFELDRLYQAEMAQRRHLLATTRDAVFAACPQSALARAEALSLIVANLTAHHPDWFTRQGGELRNHLTNERWDLDNPALDRLELAGRLVQEDLCVIQDCPDGPMFTAAVLCFPSRWRLMEKIGKPLTDVHAPVPFYADRLARPVDRFMRHLKPGPVVCRRNWSVLDDAALFQPTGKWRIDSTVEITADNAGTKLYLRVERQSFRRLPDSGAVLFGIRVHCYTLARAIDQPATAAALADAVRVLPVDILHYKSLLSYRSALLHWLDHWHVETAGQTV